MTKILLIEDLPDNAALVRRALSQTGYEVAHAADAETGLEMAVADPPALILLDLGLPDSQDLDTFLQPIIKAKGIDDVPIVALTAWPEETAREMVESYGFDGYLSKPIVKISQFVAEINAYLQKSK